MSLESLFYETLSQKNNFESKYDSVVLFSGGKDSTYLAHLIKKAKAERGCLFSVDNSFEDDNHLKVVAAKLNLDLFVFKPKEEDVYNLYNFLLSEPILKEIDANPLCFLCNRYFTSLGVDFAHKFGIPFVVSGVTATQIFGTRMPLSRRLLILADKALKTKSDDTYSILKSTDRYKQDMNIQRIVDKMFLLPDDVTIINPFLYFEYDIEKIKKELEIEYDWKNPDPNLPNQQYASSGCKLSELFGIFVRKLGFKIHEIDQFRVDYENGSLSQEALRYNMDAFDQLLNKEITDEMREMLMKININLE